MAVMTLEFPPEVDDLCADLAGRGFDILEEKQEQDCLVLVLQGPVKVPDGRWLETFVRLTERARDWSIAVRFEGMINWITVQAWAAFLDGTHPDEFDLAGLTDFVRYRLPDAGRLLKITPPEPG